MDFNIIAIIIGSSGQFVIIRTNYNNFCLINFSTILVKTISHPYLSLNVFFAWKMMTMLIQPVTTHAWIPVHQASNFSWHVRDALILCFFLWKREDHPTLLQPYHPNLNCNKEFCADLFEAICHQDVIFHDTFGTSNCKTLFYVAYPNTYRTALNFKKLTSPNMNKTHLGFKRCSYDT